MCFRWKLWKVFSFTGSAQSRWFDSLIDWPKIAALLISYPWGSTVPAKSQCRGQPFSDNVASQLIPEKISSDEFNAKSLYVMQKQLVTLLLQLLFTVFHRVHCSVLCRDVLYSRNHSTSTTTLDLVHSYMKLLQKISINQLVSRTNCGPAMSVLYKFS